MTRRGEAVSRRAHNPQNAGANPAAATTPQRNGIMLALIALAFGLGLILRGW